MFLDLCSLCFGCMSRGEIEAPMMIMSYLSQSSELSEGLLACYISSALDNGLTLKQALENLNEHVNIKPFQWVGSCNTFLLFLVLIAKLLYNIFSTS